MKVTEVQRLLSAAFEKELTNYCQRHVVFWYDEVGEFIEEIHEIELGNVRIWTLTEYNLFATKYELETVDTHSHFLIYANMPKPNPREDWLLSHYKMGMEFATDKITIQMRELGLEDDSLRPVFKKYAHFFKNKKRFAAFQSFSVHNYNEEMIDITVLATLTKSPFPILDDVVRVLLKQQPDKPNQLWEQIEKYGDVETFWRIMDVYYGYSHQDRSLSSLMCYFTLSYLSEQISTMEFPETWQRYVSNQPMNAIVFMNQWMNNSVDCDVYNQLADYIANIIQVEEYSNNWDIEVILEADAFRQFDEKIISYVQEQLIHEVNQFNYYRTLLKKRRMLHWYPDYKYEYEAIEQAIRLCKFKHNKGSFIPEQSSYEMFQAYINDYYRVDLCYRKFYTAYDQIEHKERLTLLREKIEHIYINWFLQELSVKWTSSLERQDTKTWFISDIHQQVDFYQSYVQPFVTKGERVFVIISDALRFEVAKELIVPLNNEWNATAEVTAMQSVIPSYTDLGMAVLLPHKTVQYEKQNVFVDGMRASGTTNRTEILKQYVHDSIAITYADLLAKSRSELRETLTGKKLVYIYHNSIDARGDHAATEMGVFEAVDKAIRDIRLLIDQLVNNISASNILITADHGFLYQRDAVDQRDKVPQHIEEALWVKRRFILSKEVVNIEGTLTYKLDDIVDSTQSLYAILPKGTGRFAIQGAGVNYVHGGAMLQECVVPVITFKQDRSKSSSHEVRSVEIKLISPIRKITNPITYLEFFQIEKVEAKLLPLRLKLYFIDEAGQRISNENMIIGDRESTKPEERTYKEKFIFKTITYDKQAPYYLLLEDMSGAIYEKISFSIDLTF